LGVNLGLLVWAVGAAVGLAALLAASAVAFSALRILGVAYLIYLGTNAWRAAKPDVADERSAGAFRRGLLTNLLNPKIGVFYVSFLPQFVPAGVPAAPWMFMLAGLHVLMGLAWFAAIIGATRPISGALQKAAVVRWLDRITGGVFLGFGVRLALSRR
jgi:threonine/homoserine/homoserine lactone efflux protein